MSHCESESNRPHSRRFLLTFVIYHRFFVSGATLVLSYPHFLYADPIYANGVIGMHADEDTHRIFMDIEPVRICFIFTCYLLVPRWDQRLAILALRGHKLRTGGH